MQLNFFLKTLRTFFSKKTINNSGLIAVISLILAIILKCVCSFFQKEVHKLKESTFPIPCNEKYMFDKVPCAHAESYIQKNLS